MTRLLTVAGFLTLGFDAADFTITGLSVAAVLVLLIAAWLGGVFTEEFWIADAELSRELDATDLDLKRRNR